jgi:hypothetical protein
MLIRNIFLFAKLEGIYIIFQTFLRSVATLLCKFAKVAVLF